MPRQKSNVKDGAPAVFPRHLGYSLCGTVEAVNEELESAPEKVNEDAYAAWIIKVRMSDESELESLMDSAAYAKITE